MFGLGTMEIAAILVLGVLLFGSNLPQVGRYLAKFIREFQSGMRGLEEEVQGSLATDSPRPPKRVAEPTPKFDNES